MKIIKIVTLFLITLFTIVVLADLYDLWINKVNYHFSPNMDQWSRRSLLKYSLFNIGVLIFLLTGIILNIQSLKLNNNIWNKLYYLFVTISIIWIAYYFYFWWQTGFDHPGY